MIDGPDAEGIRRMRGLLRGFAERGGAVPLPSHLLGRGGGRRRPDDDHRRRPHPSPRHTRAELLTASGPIVEAGDLAGLDAALQNAGLATHATDGDRRLVEAEPVVIARLSMANDVVLRRLVPTEDVGVERLLFELTTSGRSAPSPKPRSIHPEPARATARAPPPSPHRSVRSASTNARASAASSRSSCARWSTPARTTPTAEAGDRSSRASGGHGGSDASTCGSG